METPSTLVDNIAVALRAIPEVLSLLEGDPANVIAYKPAYPTTNNVVIAIAEMNPPAVLVAHTRTVFGRLIDHQFTITMRPRGSADALFAAIREGIPTGYGGDKFKRAIINPSCHPPMIQQYQSRLVSISETAVIEIQEITISLTERGADT
jgi:hypothetical protein